MDQSRGETASAARHWPALDGLRGVAVLLVVVFHATDHRLSGGFFGVDIFFVLSGFLITTILLQEHDRTGTVRLGRFYLRRALRLLPALVVLCAALIAARFLSGAQPLTVGVAPALLYYSNWVTALSGPSLGPLEPTWSLAIEEQFYLVWPLLLMLLRGRGRRVALGMTLFAIATSTLWRSVLWTDSDSYWRVYVGSDTRADAILIGCALALAVSLGLVQRLPQWLVRGSAVAGLLVIVVAAALASPQADLTFEGGMTAVALAAAGLIVVLAVRPWPALVRAFSFEPLVRIGQLSYGLYLWNVPTVRLVKVHLGGLPKPAMILAIFTLNWLLACASYHLVEARFLRLKNRMDRRRPSDTDLSQGPAPTREAEEVALPLGREHAA